MGSEMEITPFDNVNEVYKPLQLSQGAISNISLAVLRGKVKFERYDDVELFQVKIKEEQYIFVDGVREPLNMFQAK